MKTKLSIKGKIIMGLFNSISFLLGEYLLIQVVFQHDRPIVYIPCIIGGFGLILLSCTVHDYVIRRLRQNADILEDMYRG